MLIKWRGYIAVFLLALFVMPGTVQLIHKLEHDHGESCHEKEIHFCDQDEQCQICDFSFSNVSAPDVETFDSSLNIIQEEVSSLYQFAGTTSSAFHFLLRGPPRA